MEENEASVDGTCERVETSGSIMVEAVVAVMPHMTHKCCLAGEYYTGARINLSRVSSGGDVAHVVPSEWSGAGYDECLVDGIPRSECTER